MSPRLRDESPANRRPNPPRKHKSKNSKDSALRAIASNPTLVGFALFMLLVLGGTVKFIMGLPTPQEVVVKRFFTAVHSGDYATASACLEGGRFEVLGDHSLIRGVPGGEMSLATVLADEVSIQAQLPHAQLFVSAFRFDTLKSQRDKNPDRKTVQFSIAFDLYPGGRRPMSGTPPSAMRFVIEGHAIVVRAGSGWVIHALDFRAIPQSGTKITDLLQMLNGSPEPL